MSSTMTCKVGLVRVLLVVDLGFPVLDVDKVFLEVGVGLVGFVWSLRGELPRSRLSPLPSTSIWDVIVAFKLDLKRFCMRDCASSSTFSTRGQFGLWDS